MGSKRASQWERSKGVLIGISCDNGLAYDTHFLPPFRVGTHRPLKCVVIPGGLQVGYGNGDIGSIARPRGESGMQCLTMGRLGIGPVGKPLWLNPGSALGAPGG